MSAYGSSRPLQKAPKRFRTTSAGFEPTRAEPTRFRVWRLNHSAMMPKATSAVVVLVKQKHIQAKVKSDTFSICACHPCAGAMLIFSVSFQFFQMPPEGGPTRIRHARSAEWEHYQSCVNGSDPLSKKSSRSGNRTPGASVTGSNVTNYTNRD